MNSRTKGHQFERQMCQRLRGIFPKVQTCRFVGDLWSDRSAIDLANTPGFHFQCKALERCPSYHDILDFMPKNENVNVVIHKKNRRGIIVAMKLDDFLELINDMVAAKAKHAETFQLMLQTY